MAQSAQSGKGASSIAEDLIGSLDPKHTQNCALGLGEIGPEEPNFKIKTGALGFQEEIGF